MKPESHRHPRLIAFTGWILILAFIYLLLVALNFVLSRIEYYFPVTSEAQKIENLRVEQEDKIQIKDALSQGYERLMLPNVLDDIASKVIVGAAIKKLDIGLIGGQTNTNVFFCNEGYGLVKYKTDRFGLRNNDELWDKLETLDILLIGDSFAQGACVDNQFTISGYLSSRGFISLNLGSASNGPQNYAFLSKVFTKITRPKYVVNIFYSNDSYSEKIKKSVIRGIYHKAVTTNYDFTRYWKKEGNTLIPSKTYLSAVKQYHKVLVDSIRTQNNSMSIFAKLKKADYWLLKHSRDLIGQAFVNLSNRILGSELDNLSKLAIDTIVDDCKKSGCIPIFVYIPNSDYFRPDPYAKEYRDNLKKYVRSIGLKFLDASKKLDNLGSGAYAVKGQHLSPSGYNTVSRLIIDEIDSRNTK